MTQEQMILAAARGMTMRIEELTKRNRELETRLIKMSKKFEYDAVTKLQVKSIIAEMEYLLNGDGISTEKVGEILDKILELKNRVQ